VNARAVFVLWGVLAVAGRAEAQEARVLPDVVQAGFEALVSEGYETAMDVWAATWANERDQATRAQVEGAFRQLFESYGPTRAYDVVEVVELGNRLRNVYGVLVHDDLPVYVMLVAYDAPDGWRVTTIVFNVLIREVFPERLISGG